MPPDPNSTGAAQPASNFPPQEEQEEGSSSSDTLRPGSAERPSSGTAEAQRQYGTLEPPDAGTVRRRNPISRGPSSPAIRRDLPPPSPGLAPLSPQATRSQRRPSAVRRSSTNRKQLPHRGEHFSVDDDPSEVEEDRELQSRDRARSEDFSRLTRVGTTRRRTAAAPTLPRVDSLEEDEDLTPIDRRRTVDLPPEVPDDPEDDADEEILGDDDDTLSDAESFTLKDRQLAINQTHPFGIRIWKPALYKKNRSVEKGADQDIHSSPSQIVSKWLWLFNGLWTIFFGWWLALAASLAGIVCIFFLFDRSAVAYGRTFLDLAWYLFWPFGRFVKLEQDENYADEDEGEGRSISEYERWQSGDLEYGRLMFGPGVTHVSSIIGRHRNSIDSASEHDSLLGRNGRSGNSEIDFNARKRRLFGRGNWSIGRIVFFGLFYFFVAPLMLTVALLCWLMVFWIPMGRVLTILLGHIRKRPLALTFHRDVSHARDATKPSSIVLCTYRAAGLKYWKYTVDGTNIFIINSLSVVIFILIDFFLLREFLGIDSWVTSPGLLFTGGLIGVIPLAYFIGQAVASISAQSTMGLGAAINAFFSTVVEVFLYCVALSRGKARLVEGSIIGSLFAGMLLLPGLSMCFGALRRKTQKYNLQSTSASTTLTVFAMIGAFSPTLFFKIYGSHELICKSCTNTAAEEPRDCRACYFRQIAAPDDPFFLQAVRPYIFFASVALFVSYGIGCLFTLRTHAAVIWQSDQDEKKHLTALATTDVSPADTRGHSMQTSQILPAVSPHAPKTAIKDSQMYRRILNQSLQSAGLDPLPAEGASENTTVAAARDESGISAHDHGASASLPHVVPPKNDSDNKTLPELRNSVAGLSEEDSQTLLRQVAALASTAATVAARDAVTNPRQTSYMTSHSSKNDKSRPSAARLDTIFDAARLNDSQAQAATTGHHQAEGHGGHDAPNWSKTKSVTILLSATLLYAADAEVLVDTVDVILQAVNIDEKFLGMTLFALVPNTTEFLNAISFAINGNIALSMEIGSAYVLQVALLQIPALVWYSFFSEGWITQNLAEHTFNMVFPQFDMVTVILTVILLSYVNLEGKSNYFKGGILVLAYSVILIGFFYSSFTDIDALGINPDDTLALTVHSYQSMQASAAKIRNEL